MLELLFTSQSYCVTPSTGGGKCWWAPGVNVGGPWGCPQLVVLVEISSNVSSSCSDLTLEDTHSG